MTGISGNNKVSNIRGQWHPNFRAKGEWVKSLSPEKRLARIQECRDQIKIRNLRMLPYLLDIVIGSNFQKEILEAAEAALESISSYEKKGLPFEQLGFTLKIRMPHYVGALFELLPQETALTAFKAEYIGLPQHYTSAGKGLLSFSSAKKAAEFIRALKKDKDDNTRLMTEKFLKSFRNISGIRNFPWRRYDVDDVQRALKELEKKPK